MGIGGGMDRVIAVIGTSENQSSPQNEESTSKMVNEGRVPSLRSGLQKLMRK
jgi:hypothetical protein